VVGGVNPWIGIWTSPRSTIRGIVNLNPRYGVFALSWIYAFHTYFFLVSYWALGISYSFYSLLLIGILSSALTGWIWIYCTGWILYFTGRWLGGEAPVAHARTAAAWSKIPFAISLFMWIILMVGGNDLIFVNGITGPSALFLHAIGFILSTWSLVLLFLSVQEIQGFSFSRTLANLLLFWIVSSVFWFFVFFIFHYLYITI
jgi:hypothetical protein